MSDQIVQSVNGTNASSGHRSLWMGTSSDAAGETHNHNASRNKRSGYAAKDDDLTNGKGIIPRGCHSLGEGTSKNLPKWMQTHLIGEHSPLQETSLDSSSHIVPYRFYLEETKLGKERVAISPLISRSNVVSKQVTNGKTRVLEQEQCHDHHRSQSENPMDVGYKANITLDRYLSAFGRDCVLENQKFSGIRMFPGQCITEAETRKPRNDCHSLLKFQNCVRDVETRRICTTTDDSEGAGRGCPGFSQTTQGLLITEKIDVNLLKEDDMCTSTRVISKTIGDTSSDLHHVSLFLGQGKPKIESQPLSSSIDLDVKEKARYLKASKVTIKNEFSAETDSMEMESFREKNLHSGSCSTGSTKVLNKKSNLSSWLGLASSVKVEYQRSNIELPDMNFPILPENSHPVSSKKNRSIDMETLVGHDDYPNADPGMRWVKRLKLNSSNSSAQYTKISNLSENQSRENVSNSLSTILESSSEPTPPKHHDKESNPSDKSEDFINKYTDNLIEDPSQKAKGLLLSHAWVQRWLSKGSRIAQTKPETLVVCEQQGSRFALEELEREMCPSIKAMALMGKALTCFQPCELQKRGSLTIWNTNAI